MPDMKTSVLHMRGHAVKVDGTHYDIDEYGIIRDVSDQDAKKLLKNSAGSWNETYAPPRMPIVVPEPEPELVEETRIPDESLTETQIDVPVEAPTETSDEIPDEVSIEVPVEPPKKKPKKAKRKTRKAAKAKKKE